MRKTKTLLGVSLFGLLLLSLGVVLTKSRITQAQQSFTRTNIMYTGIDSNAETLYALRFQDLTTMEIFNNNVFRTSEVPVIVNGVNLSNQSEIASRNTINSSNNSNILGGDWLKIEGSDDITVIGGEGDAGEISVHPNNSYATFLGGLANKLFENGEIQVPVVLLGGEKNIVRPNHNASVIVGGVDNQIHDNTKNVSILGGENDTVEGDRSNIIIGGENVRIHEVDDVFVFSDGLNGEFVPEMGGAFYLNVQNGVGFGTGTSGSGGVVSNGAVSLGGNIDDIECNEDNIGIQGTWNGCLVGCTQAAASVTDWDTWELLDHGPSCAEKCESSNKCMQLEEKAPEEIESYTSFCTEGLVFTGNSTLCPDEGEGLDKYQNVVFETNLIDSEATCPTGQYNKCVYQCNSDTHLTGDVTGKFVKNNTGITMCFHDCRLPWDDEGTLERKKHNETIFAYDATDAYCSSDDNKKDHCGNHKKELICVDGRWYTTNSHKAAAENTKYVYETCTLNRYECGTGYDLTREEIVNEKEDFMLFWRNEGGNQDFMNYLGYLNGAAYVSYHYVDNLYDQFVWKGDDPKQADRSQQQGVRGVYKLCIDYVPDTFTGDPTNVAPGNEACREKAPLPYQYHYKFLRCSDGYDKDSFGVCRKRCTFGTKTIKHTETISLYTGSSATCTDICHAETFRCYDGTLYQDSTLHIDAKGKLISGVPHRDASMSIYNQLNCTLNGVTCPGYITTQGARNRMENFGVFDECQKYSAPDRFTCNPGDKMYKLQYCNSGFYSGISDIPEFAGSERCYFCPSGYYTNGTGATEISQCMINCPAGTYVATANQQCVACPTGTQSSAHPVNGGSTSNCTACNNKPDHSHYVSNGSQNNCNWECDANYYQNGNSCEACPTGYNSNTGSTSINQCKITCSAGNYVATQGAQCSACPVGTYSYGGVKYYPNTGTLNNCTNGPDNSEYTTSGVTSFDCPRQCSAGYYKDTELQEVYYCPANVNGACYWNPSMGQYVCDKLNKDSLCTVQYVQVDICSECPSGYTSDAGATSSGQCYKKAVCGTANGSFIDNSSTYCSEGTLSSIEIIYGIVSEVGDPNQAVGERWNCVNGNHSISCMGHYPETCTGPCGTAVHGDSLTCYSSSSKTCPDTCQPETRVCVDSVWYYTGMFKQVDFMGGSVNVGGAGTSLPIFELEVLTGARFIQATYAESGFTSSYTHSTCTLNDQSIDGYFSTKAECENYYQTGSVCTLNNRSVASGNLACVPQSMYKFDHCGQNYHSYEGKCWRDAYCGASNGVGGYTSAPPDSGKCPSGMSVKQGSWENPSYNNGGQRKWRCVYKGTESSQCAASAEGSVICTCRNNGVNKQCCWKEFSSCYSCNRCAPGCY